MHDDSPLEISSHCLKIVGMSAVVVDDDGSVDDVGTEQLAERTLVMTLVTRTKTVECKVLWFVLLV